MNAPQRILITGFMGAGKTTVAAALAQRLSCQMIDLDQYITEREGRTVQSMIDDNGEACFRETEMLALRDALETSAARIIALGGGAWTIAQNRALIAKYRGFTVWLDAPFELCWQRIVSTVEPRPLARGRERALRLYDERRSLYELADLHIQIREGISVDDMAAEVAGILLRQGFRI